MPAQGRAVRRELGIVLAFAALTVAMTWPWAARIRTAAADAGDPYINAWTLWWDYHQTFHDPRHLFDANIFFPHAHTLAFSEHEYGLALPFFPLFAAGVAPLSVVGVATLLGFLLSGYAAFRLARTLTGSTSASFVAGVLFAFTPYRFSQLAHLPYLFSAWIPLLFEALVLFARERTGKRAAWLGVAFLFNGLTAIHWLVLTAIPFGACAVFLAFRVRDRRFVLRGLAALALASVTLVPFLLPYHAAAKEYGFVRSAEETLRYSSTPRDWLGVDEHNRFWSALHTNVPERALAPGLLALLLPFGLLARRRDDPGPRGAAALGLLLLATGFAGSLGLRFAFHAALFEWVPGFRSIRVPARWAMLGHLGLALLAAAGIAALLARAAPRTRRLATAAIVLALLVELRAAPLGRFVIRGAAEPDELAGFLRTLPMPGGVVELPADPPLLYGYVLRAADHGRPIVNAVSGFEPPLPRRIRDLSRATPISDLLMDFVEEAPGSVLVIHEGSLAADRLPYYRLFLARSLDAGRLRFLRRVDDATDVYAVTKHPPEATGATTLPWSIEAARAFGRTLPDDPGLLGSLDEPWENAELARTPELAVRGWARVPGEDLAATFRLDGRDVAPLGEERLGRDDVCRLVPRLGACGAAGFHVTLPAPREPGEHRLEVTLRAADGRTRRLPARAFRVMP